MSNKILKISNLSFSYNKKSKKVLNDINLEFEEGKFYAILGPNGSGKSTLLKCINKYLDEYNGQIVLDNTNYQNTNIKKINLNSLAKEMSYVPQQISPTMLNLFEYVMLGRRPYINISPNVSDYQHCTKAIDTLELNKQTLKKINELSGGEQQSANIARAFAQNTSIMLLDEPTNNLDIKHQHLIFNKIKKKIKDKNLTVICILHDINQAIHHADKVVLMNNGKIVDFGSPDIITDKVIEEIYEVRATIFDTNNQKYVFI